MKKITIIGSGSFLARNLIKYLTGYIQDEFYIACYDCFPPQEGEVYGDDGTISYNQIDFSDCNSVKDIDFDVAAIFIFIGRTGTLKGFESYRSFIDVNETYLLNILTEYVNRQSHARIIYPGTRLIFRPDKDNLINENHARELRSIYAVTKQVAEEYLRLYRECYGIDYVILRICTPFGSLVDSDGNYGTFEIFRNQAKANRVVTIFGDGTDKKTYSHMLDICEAFYRLLQADTIKHHSYNLGGQHLSMNEAVSSIVSDLDAEIQHVDWPREYLMVDGGSVMFDSRRFDEEFGMTYHPIIENGDWR